MKVTVVLPAKNEEVAISGVLAEIKLSRALLSDDVELETLVIDSSSDNTAEIASRLGAKVIHCGLKGKGNAFRASALYLLLHSDSDIIIMSDADSTYPLIINIPKIVSMLIEDNYDVVIGYRKYRQPGSMTKLNLFGNKLLSGITTLLYRFRIRDVCSGLWGFKQEALGRFDLTSQGFTLEADLFTNAIYSKCKIGQFPIKYRARLGESSAKFKPGIDWMKILKFLIVRRVKRCHPYSA